VPRNVQDRGLIVNILKILRQIKAMGSLLFCLNKQRVLGHLSQILQVQMGHIMPKIGRIVLKLATM